MKIYTIAIIALLASIVIVSADVKIGKYTFVPAFKQTAQYNYLTDYDELSSSAKDIVAACQNSGDRKGCIQQKLNSLTQNSQRLSWGLDSCPSSSDSSQREWTYSKIAEALNQCSTADSASPCVCGEVQLTLNGRKIQFTNNYGSVLMAVYNGDNELVNFRRSIPVPSLSEYDAPTKTTNQLDGFTLTEKSCSDKGYCDAKGILRFVKTSDGASFLKSGNLPYCKGLSPVNHFVVCAQTKQTFSRDDPEFSGSQPIQYRFALTVGTERKELLPEFRNKPAVIELENQISKYESNFASSDEFEKWREYVLASAYQESGFEHFEADGKTVKTNVNNPGTSSESRDHGAMQINDKYHPDCFNQGGNGICSAVSECNGKTADDLTCNVAAGVYYHYQNYLRAKTQISISGQDGTYYDHQCKIDLDAYELAMKFYNAGCSYLEAVESKFDVIFEKESISQPSANTPGPTVPTSGSCADPEGVLTYVDRNTALSQSFGPPGLAYADGFAVSSVIEQPLLSLKQAGANAGISIKVISGYRSYDEQVGTFNYWVSQEMQTDPSLTRQQAEEKANTYSARPGHSEHQLGTAVDLNSLDTSFEGTPEQQWLAQHAEEYGFVLSYPKNDLAANGGYMHEPWHFRYVGRAIAQDLKSLDYQSQSNDWTLNKYLREKCGLS